MPTPRFLNDDYRFDPAQNRIYLKDAGGANTGFGGAATGTFWTTDPTGQLPGWVQSYYDKSAKQIYVPYPIQKPSGPAWDEVTRWTSQDRGSPWWQGALAAAGVIGSGVTGALGGLGGLAAGTEESAVAGAEAGAAGGLGGGGFGAAADSAVPSTVLDPSLSFAASGPAASGGLDFGAPGLTAGIPEGQAALASSVGGTGGLNFGVGGLTTTLPQGAGGGAGGTASGNALQKLMLARQLAGLGMGFMGTGGTGSQPLSIPQGGAAPGGVTPAQLSAIQSEKGPGLAPWYINRMQGKGIGPGISGTDPNMMALMMMQQNPEMFGRG